MTRLGALVLAVAFVFPISSGHAFAASNEAAQSVQGSSLVDSTLPMWELPRQ
jgi:hypothetical protein